MEVFLGEVTSLEIAKYFSRLCIPGVFQFTSPGMGKIISQERCVSNLIISPADSKATLWPPATGVWEHTGVSITSGWDFIWK